MSESNPIRVFVVHLFAEQPDYVRVFEYLESKPNFFYRNCSVPDPKFAKATADEQKDELRRQIEAAEIVILPVAMFPANPVLVTYEVDTAKSLGKPVLAVKSFGETQVIKQSFLNKADDIVDWNNHALIEGVKRLARHDSSGAWEVIDFKLD